MQGLTFNLQKFSIHDGPGIRTTVFLKGCPLKCRWCSNPESQLKTIQITCDHERCLKCQTCLRNCPKQAIDFKDNKILFDHHKCIGCLECVEMCPVEALSPEGKLSKVDEIVDLCLQDIDFYEESNGGVTFSGGEAMSQPRFLKALINELKKHQIHLAIETTGYIKSETFQDLAKEFDLLLYDIKHYNRDKHFAGTGVYNDLILDNLRWMIENNIPYLIRIPVIPGFNDSLEDARNFVSLFQEMNIKKVQLLPFHQFGEKKYELLNYDYDYKGVKNLHKEDLKDYQNIFIKEGLECIF